MSIRPATASDYAFIDRLQDMHSKALGFMPRAQLEGKINAGHVLVAEDEARLPIGYCMSQDRYFKRDDVGIIYQMNIAPGKQRSLVGAALVRAVFDRAAYGCRLFCCWCAQDLDANYFWESLGFVALAFRAGAKGKRAHIFWQRRVALGDTTTPYWFPCKTDGGMMREGRIVLPIPPGVHWKDEMPMLLPEVQNALPEPSNKAAGRPCRKKLNNTGEAPVPRLMPPTRRGARFGPPSASAMMTEPVAPSATTDEKPQPKSMRAKAKIDPKHLAKARELRDRYLEQYNGGSMQAALPAAKYDVARAITHERAGVMIEDARRAPALQLPSMSDARAA